MKKIYIVLDTGCIECGEPSYILGVFEDKKRANEVLKKYEKIQKENWHGEHYFEVIKIDKFNEEINNEYYLGDK